MSKFLNVEIKNFNTSPNKYPPKFHWIYPKMANVISSPGYDKQFKIEIEN
jgi:hypothetical protein